jgi:hypothetical protein
LSSKGLIKFIVIKANAQQNKIYYHALHKHSSLIKIYRQELMRNQENHRAGNSLIKKFNPRSFKKGNKSRKKGLFSVALFFKYYNLFLSVTITGELSAISRIIRII